MCYNDFEVVILTVGERIKSTRKEKALTQKALGELCEMSEPMIRQYELGLRNPKQTALEKIAVALGVSSGYLQGLGIDTTGEYKRSPLALNGEEEDLVTLFRKLTDDGRDYLLDHLYISLSKYRKKRYTHYMVDESTGAIMFDILPTDEKESTPNAPQD